MRILTTLLLLATTAVTGCAATQPCTGTIRFSAGSMPPPHSHSWTVTLQDNGTAAFTVWPTNTEEVNVRETFPVDAARQRALCRSVPNVSGRDQGAGGASVSWELGWRTGRVEDRDQTAKLTEATREFVGPERFDAAIATYEAWAAEQE